MAEVDRITGADRFTSEQKAELDDCQFLPARPLGLLGQMAVKELVDTAKPSLRDMLKQRRAGALQRLQIDFFREISQSHAFTTGDFLKAITQDAEVRQWYQEYNVPFPAQYR
tara:strand:+ start:163 stop:498 length:336 start_codon:yes stop_codon:yes gene_type:complete